MDTSLLNWNWAKFYLEKENVYEKTLYTFEIDIDTFKIKTDEIKVLD